MDRDPYDRMQFNSQFVEIVKANFGKDAKCITGCEKGIRSMKAAELLLSAGFTNVVDMRGGYGGETNMMGQMIYAGWAPRGLPTATESDPIECYENLARKTD